MGDLSPDPRSSPAGERPNRGVIGFARDLLRANLIPAIVIGCFAGAVLLEAYLGIDLTPPCLYTAILGFHCPGCGLTRAFVALARLDFVGAYHANPLVFVVLAGSVWHLLTSQPPARRPDPNA